MLDEPTTAQRLRARLEALRANSWFEWTTIIIIIASSLTIGAKSYDMSDGAHRIIGLLDYVITIYFLIEILIRITAEGNLRRFFSSGWNIFDFIIVAGSLIPVDESQYAYLARLLRLFRVMRLIYIVPQLRHIVGALLKALPRISYVALMMFVIFYMYGAAGNLFFVDINPQLWGDVGISMLTLFRIATFEDWTDIMYETMEYHPLSWIYYLSFIFLTAFVFLNMMIGVIIEALNEEHNEQTQDPLLQRLTEIDLRLQRIEEKLVNDGNAYKPPDN